MCVQKAFENKSSVGEDMNKSWKPFWPTCTSTVTNISNCYERLSLQTITHVNFLKTLLSVDNLKLNCFTALRCIF